MWIAVWNLHLIFVFWSFYIKIDQNFQKKYFHFNILIFNYSFKYETIDTHAHAFLALIILGIGRRVSGFTELVSK